MRVWSHLACPIRPRLDSLYGRLLVPLTSPSSEIFPDLYKLISSLFSGDPSAIHLYPAANHNPTLIRPVSLHAHPCSTQLCRALLPLSQTTDLLPSCYTYTPSFSAAPRPLVILQTAPAPARPCWAPATDHKSPPRRRPARAWRPQSNGVLVKRSPFSAAADVTEWRIRPVSAHPLLHEQWTSKGPAEDQRLDRQRTSRGPAADQQRTNRGPAENQQRTSVWTGATSIMKHDRPVAAGRQPWWGSGVCNIGLWLGNAWDELRSEW